MFNATDDENTNITTTPASTTISPVSTTQHNPVFSPEMLESIKDIACPRDCNGNGICVKGHFQY
ncbi:hypothetical protein DPMN_133610 [Dreissena polymorpha]|uniref:Uncharacterized protein n=1 Tax=Dreissena polymorpha TaxID=45954 RepID=A0A9D4JB60_DREPO|nr:hypothetical protein DPMN_133610 [Dreissena polymorpha]